MKYDAAIEKYEKEGNDEIADLIKEFSYELVGLERDDPGELQRRHQLLCTELKYLYVAITRPKKRLFIYDEDMENRKPIESIWTKLDAVQRITREDLEKENEKKAQEKDQKKQIVTSSGDKQESKGSLGDQVCDPEMWKMQGLRFLKQKNYHQAIKCFRFAGEKHLALRCKAYIAAQEAQEKHS